MDSGRLCTTEEDRWVGQVRQTPVHPGASEGSFTLSGLPSLPFGVRWACLHAFPN